MTPVRRKKLVLAFGVPASSCSEYRVARAMEGAPGWGYRENVESEKLAE
jgi:hypothetical protein